MRLNARQHLVLIAALTEYVLNSRAKAVIYREGGSIVEAGKRSSAADDAEHLISLVGNADAIDLTESES